MCKDEVDQQTFYKKGLKFLEYIYFEQKLMRDIQLKILETKNKKHFKTFKFELEKKYKAKL